MPSFFKDIATRPLAFNVASGSRVQSPPSTFLSRFVRVLVGCPASRPDSVRFPCQRKGIPKTLSAGLVLLVAAGCEKEASVPPMPKDAVATVGKADADVLFRERLPFVLFVPFIEEHDDLIGGVGGQRRFE